ncbi:hypothetical protein RC62_1825 [Flavobacterium aquidurense]|uniref:Uncharacterized protein n=1 Tax=Flavobacterium aquidurense TaxID=362413 RepID=A0A0Q0W286_9FLAO|nr:hypothetical protein RC62_1825 [Flavobacterium aquidurense]
MIKTKNQSNLKQYNSSFMLYFIFVKLTKKMLQKAAAFGAFYKLNQ